MNPVRDLVTLVRAGVVRPMRPDRLAGVLAGYVRWDLTVAWGYATGAARHPDRPAIVDDDGVLSYAEVDERTTRLANGLVGRGVRPGAKVAVLCRNHRGFVETMVACVKIGAHAVLLNTGLSRAQLATVLREQEVSVVVADAEFTDLPPDVDRITDTELDDVIAAAPATSVS